MGSKMIKGGNDMNRAKDMGVIGQKKEETWRENPWRTTQNAKMNKDKGGLTKGSLFFVPTNKRMIDKALEEKWWLKYNGTWSP